MNRQSGVLIDTGPIVAILNKNDQNHQICSECLKGIYAPLRTSWPVITEAAWLLRKNQNNVQKLFDMMADGFLQCLRLQPDAAAWFSKFANKFDDREFQLADASLVYFAEKLEIESVLTLDRRDFSIYRTSDGRALHLLLPVHE